MEICIQLMYHGHRIDSRRRKLTKAGSPVTNVRVDIGRLVDVRIADAAKTIEREHQQELAQMRKQLQPPTGTKPRSAKRSKP